LFESWSFVVEREKIAYLGWQETVVIVAHDVDEVEHLRNPGNVISHINLLPAWGIGTFVKLCLNSHFEISLRFFCKIFNYHFDDIEENNSIAILILRDTLTMLEYHIKLDVAMT